MMGFLSDLWGGFTGSSQRKEIRQAGRQADAALKAGYDGAYGDYTAAMESYEPYATSGAKSQTLYDDLLGINGEEARAAAQSLVTSDPQFQGELGASSNAMLRHLNATGSSGGGKSQLAAQRVLQSTYGNWIDRYQQGGAQGFQATNAMAATRTGRGDLTYGYGATKAGKAINQGNAMAESRGILSNNLLGAVNMGLKASGIGGYGTRKV